jgi:hypothetical protein
MSVRSIANAAFAGLALAVVSLGNAPAKADVIDTFNATGTFATGSVLSGSFDHRPHNTRPLGSQRTRFSNFQFHLCHRNLCYHSFLLGNIP